MKSLEAAKEWDKLEVWMGIVWQSLGMDDSVGKIEVVTRALLLQQLSALPRFKDLCKANKLHETWKSRLKQICDQVSDTLQL